MSEHVKVENDSFHDDDFDEKKDIDIDLLKAQVSSFKSKAPYLDTNSMRQEIEEPEELLDTSSFGEKLVSSGYITEHQLEIALKEQKSSNAMGDLSRILIELNFITDTTLSEALQKIYGVTTIDLKSINLSTEVVSKIPKDVAIQFKMIAFDFNGSELKIATSDIHNIITINQAKKYFGKNVIVILYFANEFQITDVIEKCYDYEMDIKTIIQEIEMGQYSLKVDDQTYVNPNVRLVDSILMDAIKQGASDIHFEPENEFVRIRYRIDGVLLEMFSFHKEYWSAVLVRIKVICSLNIAETRNPQDGRLTMVFMGRKVDFRVSTLPTVHGENIVARILDRKRSLISLESLGLEDKQIKQLKILLTRPEGIIILTGPTGSGKTTTLYSILSMINSPEINIMTLEDPVEYQLPMIRQSSVKEGTDMSFANGVRSLMRQDPDVIFVGEVRDSETAHMTVRAAMTGHQVFTTLHTNDAIGAIPRLIDLGIKGSILAGTMISVIAQRLVRRLCTHCKTSHISTPSEMKLLGISEPITLYTHVGCNHCYNTGYKGRIAIYEIFPIDKEMDDMIARDASRKEMLNYAVTKGFKTMLDEGILKAIQGVTDIDELMHNLDMTERLTHDDILL